MQYPQTNAMYVSVDCNILLFIRVAKFEMLHMICIYTLDITKYA